MEEKSYLNKRLLILFRVYLKLIPMVLAFIYFINTVCSYFYISIKCLNYIVFILLITFVYIASYLLKFCEYHRMFLHYILVVCVINTYDYYIGFDINDLEMFMIYSIITIMSLFITLYLKIKNI